MHPSFRQRCACGALILAAVVGGVVHHDEHTHRETLRPDRVVATQQAASTSSVSSLGFTLREEYGSYWLTIPARRSTNT